MLTESELNRNVVLLSDPNKITRQKALQALCNDRSAPSPQTIESVLKIFADPAEKNRELALSYISTCVNEHSIDEIAIERISSVLIPSLVQRLGMNDIVEPSEEIRLKSVVILADL